MTRTTRLSYADRQAARERARLRPQNLGLAGVLALLGTTITDIALNAANQPPMLYSDADVSRFAWTVTFVGMVGVSGLLGAVACLWGARR